VWWCLLVLVLCLCVGTQCVPGVATRVVAKIYRPRGRLPFGVFTVGYIHALDICSRARTSRELPGYLCAKALGVVGLGHLIGSELRCAVRPSMMNHT